MASPEKRKPLRIVIPGGSGNVGRLLAEHFTHRGDSVTVLSRSPEHAHWASLPWDGRTAGAWVAALDGADVCINLAGRSVNTRATARHRAEIYNSRIDSTRVLGEVISGLANPPKVWLNASTAAIYRHALDRPMDETTGEMGGREPGVSDSWAFSVKVGLDWEAALERADTPRTRKVALRSSVVMSPTPGSIFDVLSKLVRCGLGGRNGSGRQRVSWIHEADFVRVIDLLIEDQQWTGPVNIAAPSAPTNSEFMRALRRAWRVPVGLPAAEWMIAIGAVLLRTEPELVLKSRWVTPGRLLAAGFQFEYVDWARASAELAAAMRRPKHTDGTKSLTLDDA